MEDRYLLEKIRETGLAMDIDPGLKERVLKNLARDAVRRKGFPRPGWGQLLWIQFSFVPWWLWASQLLAFGGLPFVEFLLKRYTAISGWQIFPALTVCVSAAGLLLIRELERHFSCRTMEIEQSCFLNLTQLWLLRVCCIAGADALALLTFSAFRARAWGFGFFPFAVYVLTPFFFSHAAFLFLFGHGKRGGLLAWLGTAVFLGACVGIQTAFPWIYALTWLPVWVGLFFAAAVCFVSQLMALYGKMEGEGVCWN